MPFTPPRTLPSIDVSMSLLGSSNFDNNYDYEEERIGAPSTTIEGQDIQLMPPPRHLETYAFQGSPPSTNNNDSLMTNNLNHPTTTSYQHLPRLEQHHEEDMIETAGEHIRNQRYDGGKSCNTSHLTKGVAGGDQSVSEFAPCDEQRVHSLLMEDVSKWIQELQIVRDDMQMLSVKNAILLDSLAMAGADM